MCLRTSRCALSYMLVLSLAVPCLAIDFELVPVGGVGHEIRVQPGDRVAIDVYVSGWSGHLLRGVQIYLDVASLSNDEGHTLTLFDPDSDDDGRCDPGSEAYCAHCAVQLAPSHVPSGIFADDCRDDHFAAICRECPSLWGRNLTDKKFYWTLARSDDSFDDPGDGPHYAGSFVFLVPVHASGLFQIEFLGGDNGTLALDSETRLIEPSNFAGATIRIDSPRYGDVNWDENVDVKDLFCVLDGFQGNYRVCAFDALDIEPCNRNRLIDIHDIYGVLDAFGGKESCR